MYRTYIKPSIQLQQEFIDAVETFIADPVDPQLRTHKLHPPQYGILSFSVTRDIRILYKESKNSIYFVTVGPHQAVYK